MKYVITESQYNRLTEEKTDFESFLTKRFPKIGNLKMERVNTLSSGPNRRYFDPENGQLYFRVVFKTVPSWESGVGASDTDEFIRLYVSPKIYAYVKKYGMNFEYDLMEWFNRTYDENVNSVLKKVMRD
jgi:hypothetical protein